MQFSNPLNVDCHYNITAPEIYEQCIDLELDWSTFVHGSGTGGTMMGIKKYIDDYGLAIKTVLTQPAEANDQHGIQGINDGADFLLDRSLMDTTIEIKTEDAIKRMKQFWQDTGILVGISSGANSNDWGDEANDSGTLPLNNRGCCRYAVPCRSHSGERDICFNIHTR